MCARCASACGGSSRKATAGRLDLKQDAGGIADIEFLAQYWALKWARDYPPVAMFSDTIRQLESEPLRPLSCRKRLSMCSRCAYRAYRAGCTTFPSPVSRGCWRREEFVAERAVVTAVWDEVMVRAEPV